MKEMRLGSAPQAKKLGLIIPDKLKAHGYEIAMMMELKSGISQKF
jgi:hypothetical protein